MPVEKPVDIEVRLNDIAWSFPAGHRIRIAVSTAYWPVIWPSPEAVKLTVHACDLVLPERSPRDEDGGDPFEAPEMAPLTPRTEIEPPRSARTVTRDLVTGEWITDQIEEHGVWRFDAIDLVCSEGLTVQYRIKDDDPLSAVARWQAHSSRKRQDWDIEVNSSYTVRSTKDHFLVDAKMQAWDEGKEIFHRTWNHEAPRDGV